MSGKLSKGCGVSTVNTNLIDKLAVVYYRKYNLQQFGYDQDDAKSIVAEIYCNSCDKYNEDMVSFETFLSRCVNNAIIDIVRAELNKPLNKSCTFHDTEDCSAKYLIDEWMNIRRIISRFNGVYRLIVKEILDPSTKTLLALKGVVSKNIARSALQKANNYEDKIRRRNSNAELLLAIRLVYEISENDMRRHIYSIRRKMKGGFFSS